MNKYNFIVILAEDICPNLGCYGDPNAKTPNLDKFAKENIRFNYCYSAAPVCSAARTSLNLGLYGTTAGVGNHRSFYNLPAEIKNFGQYMQQAGFYTVIGKTDFNFNFDETPAGGYDAKIPFGSRDTPTFATDIMDRINRAQGKPVFMLQTNASTHQSQYGYTDNTAAHRATMPRLKEEDKQCRASMDIPGYHFKTPEADEVWAQYHEKMTSMDRMFGEMIDAFKESHIYENSVIIFVGDNGHGIPSGKINLWNEGVHVPMLVHVPAELEGQISTYDTPTGKACDRLTCFIDFIPTALSLNNEPIPDILQGKAFLGDKKVDDVSEIFSFGARCDEGFENSRSIHEKDLVYMCDFALSHEKKLNVYQTVQSPWFNRAMIEQGYKHNIADTDRRALYRQMPRVYEELFDLKSDENSLTNVATERPEKTLELREKMFEYISKYRDDALIEEALMNELIKETGLTPYEILQDDKYYPVNECILMWKNGIDGKELDQNVTNPALKLILTKFMCDKDQTFNKFLDDKYETVKAYNAFRIGDVGTLENIAETTDNYVLAMFILDLISNTRDKNFESVYKIIAKRAYDEKTLVASSDRFKAAMDSAVNMLAARIGSDTPDSMSVKEVWNLEKILKTRMILDALDLESIQYN
ncbi:MAG: hypothetical protein ATN31_04810 [Candidatus Epulonipiscioides saccharophilum]|nr:MAG: hypothetical protein ATN31_04810 [Epulopiscium sp. AS2M-Bin001]